MLKSATKHEKKNNEEDIYKSYKLSLIFIDAVLFDIELTTCGKSFSKEGIK